MPDFIIFFLIAVFSLALIIICIGEIAWYREDADIDSQYIDENGDHIYYDRSLIEKKIFRKKFPNVTNLRTFSRLFKE